MPQAKSLSTEQRSSERSEQGPASVELQPRAEVDIEGAIRSPVSAMKEAYRTLWKPGYSLGVSGQGRNGMRGWKIQLILEKNRTVGRSDSGGARTQGGGEQRTQGEQPPPWVGGNRQSSLVIKNKRLCGETALGSISSFTFTNHKNGGKLLALEIINNFKHTQK